jgi:hypothetical protein
MSRALVLVFSIGFLMPTAALAHGPTRQKTVETIEIGVPADKVWAAIGNFQDMSWHPAIAKTEGNGGSDPGATRTLTTQDGGKINEKLSKYDAAGHSFSYEITEVDPKVLPVSNYSATLSVKDDGAKSTVEWKGAYYRSYVNNDPPPDQNDEAAVRAVTGVYKAGLEALKKKLEGGS